MKSKQVLKELQSSGTAQNRKIYGRHGVMRNGKLERKALAVAQAIGKVDVDHGETSCKTPNAVDYIKKAKRRKKKRGRVSC